MAMEDLNVIDRFVATFSAYIDSGFGLLQGDVAWLTSVLIAIDVTLAGLFWAMGPDTDVIGRFLKKVLYVGAFALILGNFALLADVVFRSFAQLGLNATGGTLTADDIVKPGFVAATGFDAAYPLLDEIRKLTGPIAFFENIVIIAVLFLAWLITLLAFFFLAIQLFVTIIEFKLTTLAGFVLIPFALWNKTSFLAEKVLGNVIASGIKLMVLAIIVGIGSTIFTSITSTFEPDNVTLEQAASVILGSLALLALGLFGPWHRNRSRLRRAATWRRRSGRYGSRCRCWRGGRRDSCEVGCVCGCGWRAQRDRRGCVHGRRRPYGLFAWRGALREDRHGRSGCGCRRRGERRGPNHGVRGGRICPEGLWQPRRKGAGGKPRCLCRDRRNRCRPFSAPSRQ